MSRRLLTPMHLSCPVSVTKLLLFLLFVVVVGDVEKVCLQCLAMQFRCTEGIDIKHKIRDVYSSILLGLDRNREQQQQQKNNKKYQHLNEDANDSTIQNDTEHNANTTAHTTATIIINVD